MSGFNITIESKPCPTCGVTCDFEFTKKQFDDWKSGAYLQDVRPDLSPDDREKIISGYCGKCFDELWGCDDE